jgi:hypothetical protein
MIKMRDRQKHSSKRHIYITLHYEIEQFVNLLATSPGKLQVPYENNGLDTNKKKQFSKLQGH